LADIAAGRAGVRSLRNRQKGAKTRKLEGDSVSLDWTSNASRWKCLTSFQPPGGIWGWEKVAPPQTRFVVVSLLGIIHAGWRQYHSPRKWPIRVTPILRRKEGSLMPGCGGHLRFPDSARDSRRSRSLAALQRKGWCRNDKVRVRRLAILFSEQ